MEQFRHIGEAIGSLKALMVFRDEIRINPRQCGLLFDSFILAFVSISEAIKTHLKFDERQSMWKPLESPLKELSRILKEGENYIRNCMDAVNWQVKAIALNGNNDCVEYHLHNLVWCVAVAFEAIEEMSKKKIMVSKKYDKELLDPTLFRCTLGKDYLVSEESCKRIDIAIKEDSWLLSESFRTMTDQISELFLSPKSKIHSPSVLLRSPDYQVKRRLEGIRTNCKEIQWLGERFAMKHAIGDRDVEALMSEFSLHSSLVHPNVMSYMYSFCEEERKEGFVLMELMSKDLASYIKEKRTALVTVDVMLQVARGMEYLHSKNIYHGDLNPSNVFVKVRNSSSLENYLQVKVANFGRSSNLEANPCIWYAPEVLSGINLANYTEKADVYSFAMICFELLTGKVPFQESHLQGEMMSRNIIAGERPLFPFNSSKYLANLTKRCWHSDPLQRPSFSMICRILRHIKRFLILNPGTGQPEHPSPSMDYFDIEMSLMKTVMNWGSKESLKVSDIPFEMYAYRVMERERSNMNYIKEKSLDSGSEGTLICGEENGLNGHVSSTESLSSSGGSEGSTRNSRRDSLPKKEDWKATKQTGQQQKAQTARSPLQTTSTRSRMSPARRRLSNQGSV